VLLATTRFPTVDLVPVKSSNLAAVGYDASNSELLIQFRNGRRYQYSRVPLAVHDGLMNAGSKGRYFILRIRYRYPTTRIR
jgi:hypothetical protein